jgi:hypothetical protein
VGDGQDRGADTLVGRQADREPHATLAKMAGKGVGGAAGVGAHHDRLVPGGRWELREREIDDLDVVGAVLEPALPGRRIPARASPVPSWRSRKHTSG